MSRLLRFVPIFALLLIGGGLYLLWSLGAALAAVGGLIWLDMTIDIILTRRG